jgi:hypothetical protein
VRTRIAVLLLAAVAGLAGCASLFEEECTSKERVMDPQGLVYRCIASEDCPRSAHVSLCVSEPTYQPECIRCEDTQCTRVLLGACS